MFNTAKYLLIVTFISAEAKNQLLFLADTPLQRIGVKFYKKELLTDKYNDPKELAYDSSSRNLFFMYMDDDLQNSGRAFVNIITKESRKIRGIKNNKATAVDYDTGEIYFGSDNGLYKYDPVTNEANNIGLFNIDIMKIIIRNNGMYILNANDHKIYKVLEAGKGLVLVGDWDEIIDFEVDNERNIHFIALDGLFCAVKGHYLVKNKDLTDVYSFQVNGNETYAVTPNGLVKIDCDGGTVVRTATMDFLPKSMTYGDYGDIFYSLDNDIYRLRLARSYLVYDLTQTYKIMAK